jgi:maltose O-acetyltransferase
MRRLIFEWRRLLGALHLRLTMANVLLWPIPVSALTTLRSAAYRRVGFRIGERVSFMSTIKVTGAGSELYNRLVIGAGAFIGSSPFFNLDEAIIIGCGVSIGPFVRIYTSTHRIGSSSCRRSSEITSQPVNIGDGAWLGVGVTVLPGVSVGAGSVVSAGSVVNRDVAPNTLVAGVPATFVRALPLISR